MSRGDPSSARLALQCGQGLGPAGGGGLVGDGRAFDVEVDDRQVVALDDVAVGAGEIARARALDRQLVVRLPPEADHHVAAGRPELLDPAVELEVGAGLVERVVRAPAGCAVLVGIGDDEGEGDRARRIGGRVLELEGRGEGDVDVGHAPRRRRGGGGRAADGAGEGRVGAPDERADEHEQQPQAGPGQATCDRLLVVGGTCGECGARCAHGRPRSRRRRPGRDRALPGISSDRRCHLSEQVRRCRAAGVTTTGERGQRRGTG